MLLRSLSLLAVAANTVHGLRSPSPFFLLSTEEIRHDSLRSSQMSTASTIEEGLTAVLGACDAQQYVFIEQPGVRTSDLRGENVMPNMQKRMKGKQYQSVVQVPEVVGGELDAGRLAELVGNKCGHEKVSGPLSLRVEDVEGEERRKVVKKFDAAIDKQLNAILAKSASHLIIYTTRPLATADEAEERRVYEMDEPPFHENMHTDLKRDLEHGVQRRQENKTKNPQDALPLFEKYMFLSPGIFMGLSVSLLLFLILYVGVSAIAGVEVSYMAFSKEMGPNANKKQQ